MPTIEVKAIPGGELWTLVYVRDRTKVLAPAVLNKIEIIGMLEPVIVYQLYAAGMYVDRADADVFLAKSEAQAEADRRNADDNA